MEVVGCERGLEALTKIFANLSVFVSDSNRGVQKSAKISIGDSCVLQLDPWHVTKVRYIMRLLFPSSDLIIRVIVCQFLLGVSRILAKNSLQKRKKSLTNASRGGFGAGSITFGTRLETVTRTLMNSMKLYVGHYIMYAESTNGWRMRAFR